MARWTELREQAGSAGLSLTATTPDSWGSLEWCQICCGLGGGT